MVLHILGQELGDELLRAALIEEQTKDKRKRHYSALETGAIALSEDGELLLADDNVDEAFEDTYFEHPNAKPAAHL